MAKDCNALPLKLAEAQSHSFPVINTAKWQPNSRKVTWPSTPTYSSPFRLHTSQACTLKCSGTTIPHEAWNPIFVSSLNTLVNTSVRILCFLYLQAARSLSAPLGMTTLPRVEASPSSLLPSSCTAARMNLLNAGFSCIIPTGNENQPL